MISILGALRKREGPRKGKGPSTPDQGKTENNPGDRTDLKVFYYVLFGVVMFVVLWLIFSGDTFG